MSEESNRYTYRLLCVCLGLIFTSDYLAAKLSNAWRVEGASFLEIGCLIFSCILVAVCLLTCLVLAFLPMSNRHTLKTAIIQFYTAIFFYILGSYRWRLLENVTKTPRARQEAFLVKLLSQNSETEYGRKVNFKAIQNREDFRRMHPLTNYENYRPYIDRLVEGENQLLFRDPVERFYVSSGTTGKCKLIPVPKGVHDYLVWHFYLPMVFRFIRLRSGPFLAPLKTNLLILTPRWRYTEKGHLPIGPASSVHESRRKTTFVVGRTLPVEAEVYLSEQGQCYLHWLFALTDREVCRLDTTFAGGFLSAIGVLERNWQQLADDIRYGRVSQIFDIPEELVANVYQSGQIWPNRYRASEVEEECSKGFEGIIQRLWPRVVSVSCSITGAHVIHREKLQWYLGNGIRIVSMFIYASEGIYAMNMDEPAQVNGQEEQLYTLLPDAVFMEFIPEEEINQPEPNTFFMEQLEVGKRYETVITSIFGFYRYRLGDIVQVERFRNSTPVVKFCARVGSLLDLVGEKTSEDMVYAALTRSLPKWKGCRGLSDYATSESASCGKAFGKREIGLYYVIFVELENVARELSQSEVDRFDAELCEVTYPYKSFRVKGSIGKPKIFVLKSGTFEKLKKLALARNAAISNQYKTPRYLKNEDYLRLLMSSAFPNEQVAINSL